jgi:hypothetical protein
MAVAEDRNAGAKVRVAAIKRVAQSDTDRALGSLVAVASQEDAPNSVSRAAGKALASVIVRRGALGAREYELVPFHVLTGPADEAYDEAISHFQREASRSA